MPARLLLLRILLGFLLIAGWCAAEPPAEVDRFLTQNCLDCHDGEAAEAGFDLQALGDPNDAEAMARWVRLFDRVNDGEMPPQDAGEVRQEKLESFLRVSADWLGATQRAEQARLGRVRGRRLTNLQLERTLHDLLAIDRPLARLLPAEQRTDGFANIADGQPMSHFQLETHLSVVDAALDEAFLRASQPDRTDKDQFTARRLSRKNPRQRCRDPEMIDGKAVVWSSGLIFYGRITSTTVDESGWYEITFSASSVNQPKDHGVWCTVRSGRCNSGAPLMSWIGSFEATEQATERTLKAWIPAGHMLEIRPGDESLPRARFKGGPVGAGEGGPQNVPGVALHSMTMRRFHPGGDANLVRQRLFGDIDVTLKRATEPPVADDNTDDNTDDIDAAVAQVRRFARRAFRRHLEDAQLQPYTGLLRDSLADGDGLSAALRASYRAILCSPRFLYFTEPAGRLDDHAVASRLSYLLWNSMPDDELFELAEAGRLRDRATLEQQVTRMLKSPRGKSFVQDFASQWLDLVDIDFTEPDRKLYRGFDIIVQNAMLAETHAYLQDLLDRDASVRALVDSQHTYLNSRLARFYGIADVVGEELQRVTLPPDSHRGGLLSQGSILKVTANGTNTSPVLRGIWVSERILGVPIPPPPASVPAIEPDIRGAKTIREQLQKHLSDTQCASCHKNIDPPGFALEHFDAAGRWRDHYVAVERGRIRRGAAIDSSGQLADGREFKDFRGFQELVSRDVRPVARSVAENLLTYGTGAAITFADRPVVDQIVESTAGNDFGLRSILQAVVTSPIFLNK
jgi:hypothetical protein